MRAIVSVAALIIHTGAVAVISWQGHLGDAQYQDLSNAISMHQR